MKTKKRIVPFLITLFCVILALGYMNVIAIDGTFTFGLALVLVGLLVYRFFSEYRK